MPRPARAARWRRRAPTPEPAEQRPRSAPSSRVGLADDQEHVGARVEAAFRRRFGVGDPPARDDQQLLRVAGPELVAPALVGGLTDHTGGGAQRPGELAPSGEIEKEATSALPGPARARIAEQTAAAASSVSASKSPSATKSEGRAASWPAASSAGPDRRPTGRARRTSSPCSRHRARAAGGACPLVWQDGPPRTNARRHRRIATARPSSPAPSSTIWAVPRPSARATSASITRVRCASAAACRAGRARRRRRSGRAGAPPRRRRRAWTGACAPAGAVGPPPSARAAKGARVDGASAARCQEVTALAVAILGCPKRNDR